MSSVLTEATAGAGTSSGVVVNDFSLQVATANGSGSQTANSVLMRSIFQMGVPVSGKNLFPSNIQGLPTWFTIRASKDGYIGRKREIDVLVCMNPETAEEDVREARAGAFVVYEKKLGLESPGKKRSDITYFPVPFSELVVKITSAPEHAKLRKLIVNMIYVGVIADLMGIDPAESEKAIAKQLKGKKKAVDLNVSAVKLGLDYAAANFPEKIPYRVERMDATAGKLIVEGNAAAALGCLFAGATVCAWYPITPSSSLCESFIDFSDELRVDPATGKKNVAVIQAEDEIASIGMVLGAGWAGARAFTSTSGPGISLMSETIGLGYYTEIPAVVFDVQRVGPSTGLPTRTMQGDVLLCYFNSHGDAKHPVLFPASPEECFTMAGEAFDLAERLQTPVFVLSDLDLGMNNWMSDPFPYPTSRPATAARSSTRRRSRRSRPRGAATRTSTATRSRTARSPGRTTPPARSSRAAPATTRRRSTRRRPHDYVENVDRLARKLDTARTLVPEARRSRTVRAPSAGVLAYGTSHYGDDRGARPARLRRSGSRSTTAA